MYFQVYLKYTSSKFQPIKLRKNKYTSSLIILTKKYIWKLIL